MVSLNAPLYRTAFDAIAPDRRDPSETAQRQTIWKAQRWPKRRFARFRRATETPFNLILEARPG